MVYARRVFCCLLLCAPLVWAAASSSSDLAASLKGKTVLLRGMELDDKLHFDSHGANLGSSAIGSFAYSAVMIETVNRYSTGIEINGKRVAMIFQVPGKTRSLSDIGFVTLQEPVSITIALDPLHPDQADSVIQKVFAFSPAEALANDSPEVETEALDSLGSTQPVTGWRIPADTMQDTEKMRSGELKPPKLMHTVAPQYPDDARKKKLRGFCIVRLIVDTNGRPTYIRVDHSVDPSLDLQAVIAASQYRFSPALYHGKPVPVKFTVLMNFRPYLVGTTLQ